jgi:hypothetical protein
MTDTFGITTVIRAAEEVRPDADWCLWKLTQSESRLNYLLLPPLNINFLTSEPVEEVAMVRDEAADLAWALHRVPAAPAQATSVQSGDGDLVYVPLADQRVPLVLTQSPDGRFLVECQLVNRPANAATALMPAGLRVRDEEVPDEGLLLRRQFELGAHPGRPAATVGVARDHPGCADAGQRSALGRPGCRRDIHPRDLAAGTGVHADRQPPDPSDVLPWGPPSAGCGSRAGSEIFVERRRRPRRRVRAGLGKGANGTPKIGGDRRPSMLEVPGSHRRVKPRQHRASFVLAPSASAPGAANTRTLRIAVRPLEIP